MSASGCSSTGSRSGSAATRSVGDVVVFHPPVGAERGNQCGVQRPERKAGQPCPEPTPEMADTNFIKRVVAGPGDRLRIVDGDTDRQRRQAAAGGLHPPLPRPRRLRLPRGDRDPARPLLHDGRQPWSERRQPLLGTGPPRLAHRRGLLHLLAAGPHRPPLEDEGSGASAATGGEAVPLRPRVRRPASSPVPTRPAAARSPGRWSRRRCCSTTSGSACATAARSGDLDDSKQRTAEQREELYPVVVRAAARVAVTVRCVRGIDAPRPARHQPRRARAQPRAGRRARRRLPHRRISRSAVPGRAPGGDRRRRAQRRDRGRLGDREGDPRPLHAPDRRRLPGLRLRRQRRLLDPRAPGGDRRQRPLGAPPPLVRLDRLLAASASSRSPVSAPTPSERRPSVCSCSITRPRASMRNPTTSKRSSRWRGTS